MMRRKTATAYIICELHPRLGPMNVKMFGDETHFIQR